MMELLDAEEFKDGNEMSLKSGKVDQDSLKLNSRGFDSKHCVESTVDKQYEGKRHRTRPDKYGDNHSSERRKFSEKPGRRKERHQSRSTEDKHVHHRSRERSTRRKHKRSRSRSREKSSQSSQEGDSNLGEKTKMWKENESSTTEPLRRENEMSGFMLSDDQVELDHGKINRKDTGGHSCFREGSISKVRSRGVKSPSTEVEAHRTRSPSARHNFDDCHIDQVQNKRHKFNSPDLCENSVSKDRYLNSDQRHRRRRSRSRSGSHSRHNRQYRSSHRRQRSRSNSRDNSRSQHRERSGSQTDESKFGISQRRQKSRTRSREHRIREDGRADNSEDGQKRIGEEDERSRKYPQSKSESRHEYRNYDVRSGERKQVREREFDVSNAEVRSSDSERMKRRRSKSAEKNWSGYADRTFNHKFNNIRGNRGNRWISGSRDERGKVDRAFHETYRGNFRQNRWRSDIEDSGHDRRDPKARGQIETQDWHDRSRQQHEDRGQETHYDDGQHLEDMVVKSLAKLRQDSDSVKDSNVVTSDQENRSLSSQNRREDDQSTIPVLLTKKSVYVKSDVSKSCDQTLQLENSNCPRDRTESSSNESTLKGHVYSSRDRPVRHPRAGHPHFQGEFRPSAQLPHFEFQRRGRPPMPLSRGMIPPPMGVRLPPGLVQPRVIVAPFHMHPPAIRDGSRPPINWHIVGPMSAHPSPPVGPGRPMVQVGGFIRTQVPVEFLAGPPLMTAPGQFSHPPPFQPRLPPLPPHSMPAVNNQGVPLQPLPVRTGDPIRMQQPIALMHPHHIRMPSHEPRPGVVDVSNLASLHAIVSSRPPPATVNVGIPPPILPMRITGPAEAPPRYGFLASSQGNDPNTTNSSPTPPPPPPPAAVSMLDPRLNPMKPFSQQQLHFAPCHSSSSTSDESVKSDLLDEHDSPRSTKEHANENVMESGSPERHFRTSESLHSASSVGSGCSPQHTIEDAYAEALFEEPYNRPSEESDAQIVLHIPPENSSHIPDKSLHIPENLPMLSGASHKFVSTKMQDSVEATSTAINDAGYKHLNHDEEQALIPEIVNPMESPDGGQFMKESSLFGSTNPLNVSARTLDLIQVADLQKVLETVRTSVLSNEEEEEEEEAKSQDKRLFMPDRMDQIAEEVKLALKPHFGKGLIDKDEYKDIMRKTVPKIFNSKSSLDRARIQTFVQEYVNRIVKSRKSEKAKKPSSQSHKPPKHYARIS